MHTWWIIVNNQKRFLKFFTILFILINLYFYKKKKFNSTFLWECMLISEIISFLFNRFTSNSLNDAFTVIGIDHFRSRDNVLSFR